MGFGTLVYVCGVWEKYGVWRTCVCVWGEEKVKGLVHLCMCVG